VDEIDIRQDPFHRNAYVISLPLNDVPSYAWQILFEHQLWCRLDFWERKVVVVGDQLKLLTNRDNLHDKLDWLEQVVIATNEQVDEYNTGIRVVKELKELSLSDAAAIKTELSGWFVRRATRIL
jgi:hypothetical protein